jgi:hypothetical protein
MTKYRLSFLLIATITLIGCASLMPPGTKQTFPQGHNVVFDEIDFIVYNSSWGGPNKLLIDIGITNRRNKPIERHFNPSFSLIDNIGNLYEPTIFDITMRTNSIITKMLTEPLNPGVQCRGYLLFNAPPGDYRLRIIKPFYARVAFAGNIESAGHYFFIKLDPK